MKLRKISAIGIIWLLVFINLFQFFGYVNPFFRFTVIAIHNEETAIANARVQLRSFEIPVDDYEFTGVFSLTTRSWNVRASRIDNAPEVVHYIGFMAITGWINRMEIDFHAIIRGNIDI